MGQRRGSGVEGGFEKGREKMLPALNPPSGRGNGGNGGGNGGSGGGGGASKRKRDGGDEGNETENLLNLIHRRHLRYVLNSGSRAMANAVVQQLVDAGSGDDATAIRAAVTTLGQVEHETVRRELTQAMNRSPELARVIRGCASDMMIGGSKPLAECSENTKQNYARALHKLIEAHHGGQVLPLLRVYFAHRPELLFEDLGGKNLVELEAELRELEAAGVTLEPWKGGIHRRHLRLATVLAKGRGVYWKDDSVSGTFRRQTRGTAAAASASTPVSPRGVMQEDEQVFYAVWDVMGPASLHMGRLGRGKLKRGWDRSEGEGRRRGAGTADAGAGDGRGEGGGGSRACRCRARVQYVQPRGEAV
mmetsp:Transcript_22799/g.74235  ORF Transcript_22799/g.74235 Transcript_22799/m.74235 type:complete len:362 (-) Transcript_22799:890-1975(-)